MSQVKNFLSAPVAASRFPVTTIVFAWSDSAAASGFDCLCQGNSAATAIVCIPCYRVSFNPTNTMRPWSSSRLWTVNRFLLVLLKIPASTDGWLRSGRQPRILRRCFMPPGIKNVPYSRDPCWRTCENPVTVG